jgi:hypothetical protein
LSRHCKERIGTARACLIASHPITPIPSDSIYRRMRLGTVARRLARWARWPC